MVLSTAAAGAATTVVEALRKQDGHRRRPRHRARVARAPDGQASRCWLRSRSRISTSSSTSLGSSAFSAGLRMALQLLVDLHDDEERRADDEEVDDRVDERAVADDAVTDARASRSLKLGFPTIDADDRHDDVVDEAVDERP